MGGGGAQVELVVHFYRILGVLFTVLTLDYDFTGWVAIFVARNVGGFMIFCIWCRNQDVAKIRYARKFYWLVGFIHCYADWAADDAAGRWWLKRVYWPSSCSARPHHLWRPFAAVGHLTGKCDGVAHRDGAVGDRWRANGLTLCNWNTESTQWQNWTSYDTNEQTSRA